VGNIGVIQIIRPLENAAESEYIKEFFRFIGCMVSDLPVDETDPLGWERSLRPDNEEGGIDIVLNYSGVDPYFYLCGEEGIRRLYLSFSFHSSGNGSPDQPQGKEGARRQALRCLIQEIWENSPDLEAVQNLLEMYTQNKCGDLFYLLQARRSLRVLNMGEVLQEPDATVRHIPCYPYIRQILAGFWEIYVKLENAADKYSRYTRINAGLIIREIICNLHESDYDMVKEIHCGDHPFEMLSAITLAEQTQILMEEHRAYMQPCLLMAILCKTNPELGQSAEGYFLRALQLCQSQRKEYAFIRYRMGHFYEKQCYDAQRALDNYCQAFQTNPRCYQAAFKLGYYAAADGRFKEAESRLDGMIRTTFHDRSTAPDWDGGYRNWETLSLKDVQYVYKAYILLAKIAVNSGREYSTEGFVGKACLASTMFEQAPLVAAVSDEGAGDYTAFRDYHTKSVPVWAMWKVLQPWSEHIVQDPFVSRIVHDRLRQWD